MRRGFTLIEILVVVMIIGLLAAIVAPRVTDFSGDAKLKCYALYYVCEDVNGICLYRRQDVSLVVEVEG